jgi:hypothetical protein
MKETTRKRTETTSETQTLMLIEKTTARAGKGPCLICDAEVVWIPKHELELFGIVASREGLSFHTNHGGAICSRSLIRSIKNGEVL